MKRVGWILLLLAVTAPIYAKTKITKQTFEFEGRVRTYYLYVPEVADPMPVLMILHGYPADLPATGYPMVDSWKDLAAKEHIIVVAPNADSQSPDFWNRKLNPPGFFRAVIEQVKAQHPIDASRIYLFGHSAGAQYALSLAVAEGNYYAAAAVHAGALSSDYGAILALANRRIPIAIWSGNLDSIYPLEMVKQTKSILEANGYPVELNVMPGHNHDYFTVDGAVNERAWKFLKKSQLAQPQAEKKNQD
ncbi:MAG: alpha/beta hydrolase family esterase [Terracidiphilus sp.]